MVLARVKDAKKGVKGLSMFLVPKIWINQDGSKGERNGVFCTNIEKKMGIKASATCEMTFGENIPAKGFLLGNVHQGIYQMFKIIEQARMAVGIKSMSTLSTAYLNALSFCKERIQGSDIVEIFNKSAKKVAIIKHPDIRRMLMMQKSHVEGMRALCMYCSKMQDLLRLEKISNGSKVDEYKKLVDLLLPLIKGYNSEKVYKLLSSSLQCFGGSGYLSDYPIEQYIRDQKIDSLYEGTTHIQALDLIMRKIARDNATALKMLISKIESTSSKKLYKDKLGDEYNLLKIAIIDIKNIFTLMMTKIGDSLYYVGLHGNKILIALSELVISWLLLRHAEVSISLLKTCSSKKSFYYGKIASASFYCKNVLPNIKLVKLSIEKTTLELMNLSDDIF